MRFVLVRSVEAKLKGRDFMTDFGSQAGAYRLLQHVVWRADWPSSAGVRLLLRLVCSLCRMLLMSDLD